MAERLAVRGLLGKAEVPYTPDQEGAAISGLLQHLVDLAQRAGGTTPLPQPPITDHVAALASLAGNEQFRAVAAAADALQSDLAVWTKSASGRAPREAAWAKLSRLLSHADGIAAADEVRTQHQAILHSRLLLNDPDPVAPLIARIGGALRAAVMAAVQDAQSAHAAATAELEKSEEWQNVQPSDRESLIADAGLSPIAVPAVATDDDLLQALDLVSISGWRERRQALPAKAAAARAAAAKRVEPKSVEVKPPTATIRTEVEVDAYLANLRKVLMVHVDADETVIL